MDIFPFLLRFYGPILIGVLMLLLAVLVPRLVSDTTKLHFEPDFILPFLGLKLPLPLRIERVSVFRVILVGMSLVSFIFALAIDFSKYFPSKMRMDIYFDVRGIQRTVDLFLRRPFP
jgi:hypothetical protein